jgi:hypothetical protein
MRVNLFDADKAGHYIAGSAVAAIAAIIALRLWPAWAWASAIAAAALVGAAKELYDGWRNRRAGTEVAHVEPADTLATALGAVPVAAPMLVAALMARWAS